MPIILNEGRFRVFVERPFTLRELAGPWSWMAIRYYWLAFDEILMDVYVDLARQGRDPAEAMIKPSLLQIAGSVELTLEKTSLAFRIVDAEHGSIILWTAGAWKALNSLAKWLPIYGKWLQEKGQVDIRAEIERSDALIHVMNNYIDARISETLARRMAFERLYGSWPDFYASHGMRLDDAIHVGQPERTGNQLVVPDNTIKALLPPSTSMPPDIGHPQLEDNKNH
jgi:hypothetical protein